MLYILYLYKYNYSKYNVQYCIHYTVRQYLIKRKWSNK